MAGGAVRSATTRPSAASTTTTRDVVGGRVTVSRPRMPKLSSASDTRQATRGSASSASGTCRHDETEDRAPRCASTVSASVSGVLHRSAPVRGSSDTTLCRPVRHRPHPHEAARRPRRPRSAPPASASSTRQSAPTSASTGGRTPGSCGEPGGRGAVPGGQDELGTDEHEGHDEQHGDPATDAPGGPRPVRSGDQMVVVDHLHLLHATRRPHPATVGLRRATCPRGRPAPPGCPCA